MAVNFTAADRVGVVGGYIGGISALLNGMLFNNPNCGTAYNMNGCCSENTPVSRFELEQEQKIMELTSRNSLLESENNTETKMLTMYQYMDQRLNAIDNKVNQVAAAQAVTNQKLTDDMAFIRNDFDNKLSAESQARCCADNSIVNYANATFYAKLVAGVTPTQTTTPQATYNPIPSCSPCQQYT